MLMSYSICTSLQGSHWEKISPPKLMRCGLVLVESIGTEVGIFIHVTPLNLLNTYNWALQFRAHTWEKAGKSTTARRPSSTPGSAAVPTLVTDTSMWLLKVPQF